MKRVVSDLESFSLRLENMLGDGGPARANASPNQAERSE
jgi:hypothetical protein